MPELLKAAILGTVQGLTEFLPVSSTGHLILLEKALDVNQDTFGLTFDAALHLGTLLSILFVLRQDILRLAAAWLRRLEGNADARLAWLIILATAPAAILGLLLESAVEDAFRRPVLVASMLIAFSAVLVLAERLGSKQRSMADLRVPGALFIGFMQAVALVPGVSRSGSTISAGLFTGLERRQAAIFAFLLSAPVIAGAGLKKVYDIFSESRAGTLDAADLRFFAVGFVLSAIWGAVAIAFLLRYLQRGSLYVFVWYRVALGLTVLGIVAIAAAT
jgi:undecaprenyl-diphosphatase